MSQLPGPSRTFATYTEMAEAEPYLLAGHMFGYAFAQRYLITDAELDPLFRQLCAEPAESGFLGLGTRESPPVEIAKNRVLLIWEHALAACRKFALTGGEHQGLIEQVICLDSSLLNLSPQARAEHFRRRAPGAGQQTLR